MSPFFADYLSLTACSVVCTTPHISTPQVRTPEGTPQRFPIGIDTSFFSRPVLFYINYLLQRRTIAKHLFEQGNHDMMYKQIFEYK